MRSRTRITSGRDGACRGNVRSSSFSCLVDPRTWAAGFGGCQTCASYVATLRHVNRVLISLDVLPLSAHIVPMAMHKQMIALTIPQASYLKGGAERLGISVSDLIRRIIDQHRSGGEGA